MIKTSDVACKISPKLLCEAALIFWAVPSHLILDNHTALSHPAPPPPSSHPLNVYRRVHRSIHHTELPGFLGQPCVPLVQEVEVLGNKRGGANLKRNRPVFGTHEVRFINIQVPGFTAYACGNKICDSLHRVQVGGFHLTLMNLMYNFVPLA